MNQAPGTVTERVVTPVRQDGSHDLFAHYVKAGHGEVTAAYVEGTPLTALCGKVWVPSRDPKNYPICPTCIEETEK